MATPAKITTRPQVKKAVAEALGTDVFHAVVMNRTKITPGGLARFEGETDRSGAYLATVPFEKSDKPERTLVIYVAVPEDLEDE